MQSRCFFALLMILASFSGPLALAADAPLAGLQSMEAKLDQVLKNQQEILKELAALKEELSIVKIRATR